MKMLDRAISVIVDYYTDIQGIYPFGSHGTEYEKQKLSIVG